MLSRSSLRPFFFLAALLWTALLPMQAEAQRHGSGKVLSWGDDFFGQNVPPAGLSGVTSIASGAAHTLALRSNGTVVAWGDNAKGQTSIPAGLTGVIAVAAGGKHSVAL